ncbi:MAG: GYD domain-containing protein [Chloroflexota bacterium]
MPTYIMLTRLAPQALVQPGAAEEINRRVQEHVHRECHGVKWIANYAVLGPYDYVDVFDAPNEEEAIKLSLIVRSYGHATTETWIATPWDRFTGLAASIAEQPVASGPPEASEYTHIRLKG